VQRSADRILTTHTGSLPRTPPLHEVYARHETPEPELVRSGVAEAVRRQRAAGVDVVNDGEAGKPSYATYVGERLTGFGGESPPWRPSATDGDYAEWSDRHRERISNAVVRPACNGPVTYGDLAPLQADLENLRAATAASGAEDVFMTAASPGVITMFHRNDHYPSHEAYLQAAAEAMKTEYDAVHAAGFVLQLDCPDLAAGRVSQFPELSFDDWREVAGLHVEALNHATRDIPADAMRMHVCWGNSPGPHNHDEPLADIVDVLLRARPAGLSIEGANPRHGHEWRVFEEVKLPDGKVLIPGVIDSTTNYIEHPELVAERIERYAGVVGRENLIAGSDCGFATLATYAYVLPEIAWAKLAALAEGAAIASARLFTR
jgi:5-methyltetrahydropteroyltriglutamate--homocysteine methyltransferase